MPRWLRLLSLASSLSGVTLALAGCAYRLPAPNAPSQPRLRVLAKSPERYLVRVQTADPTEHLVATDGRVIVDVPTLPRWCSVHLFGIKVRNGAYPHRTKAIHVVSGDKTARRLSLNDISRLPVDSEGYRLLRLKK